MQAEAQEPEEDPSGSGNCGAERRGKPRNSVEQVRRAEPGRHQGFPSPQKSERALCLKTEPLMT